MKLQMRKVTYCTASAAHFYAETVSHESGVRMVVRHEDDFWTAEPTGLYGYDVKGSVES